MIKKILFFCLIYVTALFSFTTLVDAQVVINEFVPDSDQEWVEFYNASASAEYIKLYYVDDDTDFLSDSGSSSKKLLTNLNIANPKFPTIDTSSFLNNSGDWVVLFDQNGNLIDQYQYNSDPGRDISFGRYPDRTGSFSVLAYTTKADANSTPQTPVPTPTPTSTPNPTDPPTPTSTPTPSPSPTLMPTKSPTPLATKTPIPTESGFPEKVVLGESSIFPTPIESETESSGRKFPLFALFLVILGLGLSGFSVFAIIKHNKKSYNVESEKKDNPVS